MQKFIKLHCIDFKRNSIIELTSQTVINTDLIVSINEEEADDIFTYESTNKIYSLIESS